MCTQVLKMFLSACHYTKVCASNDSDAYRRTASKSWIQNQTYMQCLNKGCLLHSSAMSPHLWLIRWVSKSGILSVSLFLSLFLSLSFLRFGHLCINFSAYLLLSWASPTKLRYFLSLVLAKVLVENHVRRENSGSLLLVQYAPLISLLKQSWLDGMLAVGITETLKR